MTSLQRLLLASEKLSAHQMYVSGLVTEAIPGQNAKEFLDRVCVKAKRIAGLSGESFEDGEGADEVADAGSGIESA